MTADECRRQKRHEAIEGEELLHMTAAIWEIAAQLAEHLSDDALTDREVEVLSQIAGGNRNRDIGEKLFISEETVKVHIKHIMDKLGASDRTQAVAIGLRRGIIHL